MKIQKPKKSNLPRLRRLADRKWFEVFKQLKCEVCGKPAVHLHHYYPKGLYSHLRYNPDNGISLCFHCHFSKTHKGDPMVHEIIRAKRGDEWYQRLKQQANNPPKNYKINKKFYLDAIEYLENYKGFNYEKLPQPQ